MLQSSAGVAGEGNYLLYFSLFCWREAKSIESDVLGRKISHEQSLSLELCVLRILSIPFMWWKTNALAYSAFLQEEGENYCRDSFPKVSRCIPAAETTERQVLVWIWAVISPLQVWLR